MMLCTNKQERELERQVDQTQRPRYISRFEHLVLHPRLHHRVGFLIHYRSTELLSQPYKATEAIQHTIHLYRRGIRPVAKYNTHLYLRGSQTNHPITSTEEGFTNKRVFTTSGSKNHKLSFLSLFFSLFLFHKNKDPNSLG